MFEDGAMIREANVEELGHIGLVDYMGSDLTVVNAARVSFAKHHDNLDPERDPKLIQYLARNKHWSPFSHPQVQFRFEAPIFVANQLKRHQVGFALNEVSRRYVDDEPQFANIVWRKRPDASIKQGSGGPVKDQVRAGWTARRIEGAAHNAYLDLLSQGVAPEQARAILPQSMLTSWYWTGSLYAWARLYNERIHPTAQEETRAYARVLGSCFMERMFPISWKALTSEENEE